MEATPFVSLGMMMTDNASNSRILGERIGEKMDMVDYHTVI